MFGDEISNETHRNAGAKSRGSQLWLSVRGRIGRYFEHSGDMIVELFDRAICEMPGVSELSINSESSPSSIETLPGIRVDYLRCTNSWLRAAERYSVPYPNLR